MSGCQFGLKTSHLSALQIATPIIRCIMLKQVNLICHMKVSGSPAGTIDDTAICHHQSHILTFLLLISTISNTFTILPSLFVILMTNHCTLTHTKKVETITPTKLKENSWTHSLTSGNSSISLLSVSTASPHPHRPSPHTLSFVLNHTFMSNHSRSAVLETQSKQVHTDNTKLFLVTVLPL